MTQSKFLRCIAKVKEMRLTRDSHQDETKPNVVTANLPPSPRELLRGRWFYGEPFRRRRVEEASDFPIAALYRIYEHLVLDQHLQIRNEPEAFWFHGSNWKVCDIPDPHDPDPERYAVLSCIPTLLCLAFNKRIELGLPRDAPCIFTQIDLAGWRKQERELETLPAWTRHVPRLAETFAIPHWDNGCRQFVTLEHFDDLGASKEFAVKNVLLLLPHIHFA